MCYGVKEVALVNKVFTMVNIGVIFFVSIAGFVKSDFHHWRMSETEVIDVLRESTTSGNLTIQCSG